MQYILPSMIVLLALFVSTNSSAFAESPEGLEISLASAVLFALEEDPQIKMALERTKQAGYALDEARADYYPQISLRASTGKEFNDPAAFKGADAGVRKDHLNTSAEASLSLRQVIFDVATFAEIDRRKTLVDSADLEALISRQEIIEETVGAYLTVLQKQQDLEESRVFLQEMTALIDRISKAYEAGAESKGKLDYARARLESAKSAFTRTQSSLEDALDTLESITGKLSAFRAYEPKAIDLSGYGLEFLYDLAMGRNPDIHLSHIQLDAEQANLRKEFGEYFPEFNFLVEAEQSHDEGGDIGRVRQASAMLEMRYDLFSGFSRKARGNRVESRIAEIEWEKREKERDIKKNIQLAYNEMTSSRQTIESKQKELNSYLELKRLYKRQLGQGEIDLFEVIENEERINRANTEIHGLQHDLYLRSYELLRLVGSLRKTRFCESC